MYFVHNPKLTAAQAMEEYAREVFGEDRKIGCTVLRPDGVQFQLKDGRKWYRVTCASNYQGWNIEVASEN